MFLFVFASIEDEDEDEDEDESIVGVRVNAPFLWVGSHALPL